MFLFDVLVYVLLSYFYLVGKCLLVDFFFLYFVVVRFVFVVWFLYYFLLNLDKLVNFGGSNFLFGLKRWGLFLMVVIEYNYW